MCCLCQALHVLRYDVKQLYVDRCSLKGGESVEPATIIRSIYKEDGNKW
jgi:hypothetical protein